MTVIAWDGTSLAVDRQVTYGETPETVCKCRVLKSKEVIVCSGSYVEGLALQAWYAQGASSKDWPEFKNYPNLVIAAQNKVTEYHTLPQPMNLLDNLKAWGSGRELALGAMWAGKTALEAVRVTISLNIYCGMGIDLYAWKDGKVIHQEFDS